MNLTGTGNRNPEVPARTESSRTKSSNEKGSSRSDNKSQEGIPDKLQEYLAKAKERRKKGGK